MINKFIIKQNPNEEELAEIIEAVKLNDGYCPCLSHKSDATKCMCESFKKSDRTDFCHCGRFFKVHNFETIALIDNVEDGSEYFDQWEEILSKQNFVVIPVKYDRHSLYHNSEGYTDLCRSKIYKADAAFVIDDDSAWVSDMADWAEAIGKKVLHRSDLKK